MSLHELHRMSKGKVDHKEMMKSAYAATDQSSAPKYELVWENGQNSMQVQSNSSRAKKPPTFTSFPSHSPMSQEKVSGYDKETTNTRIGKFEDLDAGLNEITRPVPSREVGLTQEEDLMMPWLNCIYGMDDSLQLQHQYSPGFLHELSGVTMNEVSLLDRKGSSSSNQVFRDSHNKHYSCHVLSSEQGILSNGCSSAAAAAKQVHHTSGSHSGPKANKSQLHIPSLLHHCDCEPSSSASIRSRESNIAENNTSNATQHAPCGVISQIPPKSSGFPMEAKDLDYMSSNNLTSMNFTHFGKPVAIVKANLQNIGLSSLRSESAGIKNKGAAPASGSNPPESTQVDLSGECPKKLGMHSQNKKAMEAEPCKVDLDAAVSTPACKDMSKVDQLSNQVLCESGIKGQEAVKKCLEPVVVVSSSVCSGNGSEKVSEYPNDNFKRKSRDTESSEFNSEDIEDELVGVKRAAYGRGGMGSKRHRSAEVHNLSERRRRDRINEKMRTLQELIPNCNKADKASMLDEAIEYLKTLQLHLQIMSMGGGLYMPGMMLPAGMHAAQYMSPFSPICIGMQMGLGYGSIGMPDVNDGSTSSRFPMVQMPQLQGTHVPVALPHTSGRASLHGMERPNPQMFGLSMPIPCAPNPMFSFPGVSLMNPSAAGLTENVESASAPKLKDPMPDVGFEQSTLVPSKKDLVRD